MKSYQIKSIIRAAAMYHLYYNGYRNKNDTVNLGIVADHYTCVGNDKKQFKFATSEYAEALSPETKKAVNAVEKLIRQSVNPDGLSPKQFILNCAVNTMGEAVYAY